MFEHTSTSSGSGFADLSLACACAETHTDKVKENLVNVVFGQSVKSDIEQIAFQRMGLCQ